MDPPRRRDLFRTNDLEDHHPTCQTHHETRCADHHRIAGRRRRPDRPHACQEQHCGRSGGPQDALHEATERPQTQAVQEQMRREQGPEAFTERLVEEVACDHAPGLDGGQLQVKGTGLREARNEQLEGEEQPTQAEQRVRQPGGLRSADDPVESLHSLQPLRTVRKLADPGA